MNLMTVELENVHSFSLRLPQRDQYEWGQHARLNEILGNMKSIFGRRDSSFTVFKHLS